MRSHLIIIRPGALGDAVLTLPLIASALHLYDRITIIGRPSSWAWLAVHPRLKFLSIEDRRMQGLFNGHMPLPFDLTHEARAVLFMSGRMGGQVERRLQQAGIAASRIMPPRRNDGLEEKPSAHQCTSFGDSWPATHAVRRLLHDFPVPDRREFTGFFAKDGMGHASEPRLVVIHPGSGGRYKLWPTERFAALARHLVGEGYRVIILLGPVEIEQGPSSLFDAYEQVRAMSLETTLTLLGRADSYIGNDSGVSHVASHICPTLALFGPTSPQVWGPAGHCAEMLWAADGQLADLDVPRVLEHLVRMSQSSKSRNKTL